MAVSILVTWPFSSYSCWYSYQFS